ncbi:ROK family protein [Ruminiclostridium papyrosolvens]|uniref:Transcriptional regulator n=1 Tax=Ruminiclostridium papyrosolvens C7 TaxID=1330534 RepID=U4R786_9FIRM|nr:ROK family protein [Ruminiclostridium papyrosolvens]EPR14067.1 hypothetical protein L323_01630 [Ruminiclostridium papyrosolvens C7]
MDNISPKFVPVLDKEFRPAALENRYFLNAVKATGKAVPIAIGIERSDGLISRYSTHIFDESLEMAEANLKYVERLVKSLLWIWGGWKIIMGGPSYLGEYIREIYSPCGKREFDAGFMGQIYEKQFTVEITDYEKVPEAKENTKSIGRHQNGCRIGLDAGGSGLKVSAVINGNAVHSEKILWRPKVNSNPDYHYNEILKALKSASTRMPWVDAVGVSSAGIFINNRIMISSLFLEVPGELFEKKVRNMFIDIQEKLGSIPLEVANDGDVTALAGAMQLKDTRILGISMGTSEAGGYIDSNGNITGWLNELAFVPIDFNTEAIVDEWSGDYGCGVKYLSQDSVIKLASNAGIVFEENMTPADKFRAVQDLLSDGDQRGNDIFESIGVYLGYAIAHYADFYDIKHVLVLGGVTSENGGNIILNTARTVLDVEFPELASAISLHLPDESNRGMGQSITAASLPDIL